MLPDLVIDINCYSHVKMAQQRVKTVSAFIRREIGVSTSIWNYKTRCYWDKVDSFRIPNKERMGGTDILLRTGDEHPEHTPHAQDRCWESMRTQQADSHLAHILQTYLKGVSDWVVHVCNASIQTSLSSTQGNKGRFYSI